MSPLEKILIFYNLNSVISEDTIILKACEKELHDIMNNELTARQRDCVKSVFFEDLNQKQTAEKLGLAQPTVSRHINTGVAVLLNRLSYCIKTAKTVASHYEQGTNL